MEFVTTLDILMCRWTSGGWWRQTSTNSTRSRSDDVGNLMRKLPTRQIQLPSSLRCPYAR